MRLMKNHPSRSSRPRNVSFRPSALESCEPRIVPTSFGAATFTHSPYPNPIGDGTEQGPNGVTASYPTQTANFAISSTFTNTGSTAQYVTATPFTDPDATANPPGTGIDIQTLLDSQTILLQPGASYTVTFFVDACHSYQFDTVIGQNSPNQTGSNAYGSVLKNGPFMTYNRFGVPCSEGTAALSQGYYKNHLAVDTALLSQIGGTSYSAQQLVDILKTPPQGGDSRIILAHQLIAAELNMLSGATSSNIDSLIGQADTLLRGVDLLNLSSAVVKSAAVETLAGQLEAFNLKDE